MIQNLNKQAKSTLEDDEAYPMDKNFPFEIRVHQNSFDAGMDNDDGGDFQARSVASIRRHEESKSKNTSAAPVT